MQRSCLKNYGSCVFQIDVGRMPGAFRRGQANYIFNFTKKRQSLCVFQNSSPSHIFITDVCITNTNPKLPKSRSLRSLEFLSALVNIIQVGHVHEKAWSWTSVPWKISLDVPYSNRKWRSSNSDPRSLNKKLEVHLHFGKIAGHGKDFSSSKHYSALSGCTRKLHFHLVLGGRLL